MPPSSSSLLLLLLSVSLLTCPVWGAEESGRVRILFLGEVAWSNQLFLDWIEVEPSFALTTVPCDLQWVSLEEATRFARIYLPRTESRLNSDYDVSVFEDFSPDVLPIAVLNWIQNAVRGGMGLALIEFAYWGGSNDIPRWMDLSFYEVFPAGVLLNVIPAASGRTFYDVRNENGPVDLPGIESIPMNQGYHGDLTPRAGAVVEAVWRVRQRPAMVTSKYGAGHTLQLDHGWDNIPQDTRVKYEYLPEYIYNQVFYIAGIPIPEDVELVRLARASLIAYASRRKATIAVFEFVERFGANPLALAGRLDEMDARQAEASRLYLANEYMQVDEVLSELMEEFSELDAELMRARDRAFFWMYVVEWTSIAGASALCGTALWSLMVRRRLYRPAGTTRSV